MKNHIVVAIVLALTFAGCGSEGDSSTEPSSETAETTAPAAAEPEPAAPAAPAVYSCNLSSSCQEHRGLPFTTEVDGNAMEITVAMTEGFCTQRRGQWAEGPCPTTGIVATCVKNEHESQLYRADANLEVSQDVCVNVAHGTWSTAAAQ